MVCEDGHLGQALSTTVRKIHSKAHACLTLEPAQRSENPDASSIASAEELHQHKRKENSDEGVNIEILKY